MGFGTIIAGVYFIAVLIVSGYVITDTVNRMSKLSYESVLTASNIQLNKLESSASITKIDARVEANGSGVIYVDLLNTGNVKILSSDFSKIDVLLTYTYTDTTTDTQTKQTQWCYYDSNTPSQDQWTTNSTISPNPSPGVVDPSNWDPAETLAVVIALPLTQPLSISSGSDGYLKVVLPGGSAAAETFSFTFVE